MPKKKLSMREAAFRVFAANRNRPLKVKDLYERMLQAGYQPGSGKTPIATLAAQMYTKPQLFEKVDRGTFRATPEALKKWKAEQAE